MAGNQIEGMRLGQAAMLGLAMTVMSRRLGLLD
jgi:hypothetical protein